MAKSKKKKKSISKSAALKSYNKKTVAKINARDSGKSSSSSTTSSSSSSSKTGGKVSNDPEKYNYSYGGKSYEYKADATAASRASKSNKDEYDEEDVRDNEGTYDESGLINSDEYKSLSSEDQEAIRAVFDAVASNDKVKATRMIESFKAAAKINDPYFAQQLRLATDAIERGYVAIDKQAEFEEMQMRTRLKDLKDDYEAKKAFMTLEQAQVMKDIQIGYEQNLDVLQTSLAENGFTSSSRRVQKEEILNEATGDLRESKNRAFAYETNILDETLARSERDTEKEVARLAELTKAGKLDFLRKAEQEIGSTALSKLNLNGDPAPLGGIYGDINEKKLQDTISSMTSFVF